MALAEHPKGFIAEEDDGTEHTETAASESGRARLFDSTHMALMRQLVQEKEAAASSDSVSEPRHQPPLPHTTLNLCEVVVAGQLDHGQELLRRLQQDPNECLLTLRCNVFWPMLTRCVELAQAGLPLALVIRCLECVVAVRWRPEFLRSLHHSPQEPLSAAVIRAQFLGLQNRRTHLEQLGAGLGLCGEDVLVLALALADLANEPSLLGPVVERSLASEPRHLGSQGARQLSYAVVCVAKAMPELRAQGNVELCHGVCLTMESGAVFLLVGGNLAETLFVCRTKAKEARREVLQALHETHNLRLHAEFTSIWANGLSSERFQALKVGFPFQLGD